MSIRKREPFRLVAAVLLATVAVTGAHAEQWRLPSLDGRTVSITDYAGQWVVLNYWATWCKPCREEMPELDRLDRERGDLAVIGIAWEDTEPDRLRAFLEDTPVGYPIAPVNPFRPPERLSAPRVLPTTVLYAPDGSEADTLYGPVSRELISDRIAQLESNRR